MVDQLKFTCPKCAHGHVQGGFGDGTLRYKGCGFRAVSTSFKLEKRPSLKWDEATYIEPDRDE